jgi:hypothetical protein
LDRWNWPQAKDAGVVYRSGALHRRGFSHWSGPHQRWSELAVFASNTRTVPRLIRRRDDLDWL